MKRLRVLLAEDNRRIAEILEALLRAEFELVGTVADGLAMLASAATLHPDVVVTDISMPRLDGLSALAQLKTKHPHVKVVLISIYQDATLMALALKEGAAGYVLKHSAAHELVPAVRAAMNGETYASPTIRGVSRVRPGGAAQQD